MRRPSLVLLPSYTLTVVTCALAVGACGGGAHTLGSATRRAAPGSATIATPGSATSPAPGSATNPAPGSAAAKLAQARRTHEYPGPVSRQTVPAAYEDPAKAVQAFATVYINWTSTTVSSRLDALARLSVGAARSEVTLQAAEARRDYELKRSGVANSGTVEAVSPLAGHVDEYVVVTREQTTATNSTQYQGLLPAWHVTLATVTRVTPGWAVSNWHPQN